MKYQCDHCNYVAERKEKPLTCPYCGEKGTMTKAKEAQDYLNEF